MALFNFFNKATNNTVAHVAEIVTTNYAGGEAFAQSAEMELASILLTSFAQDQFYRSSDASFKRFRCK